jgi:hypothetical protein
MIEGNHSVEDNHKKKHAKSVIYKKNAGLGYMPLLSSYDQTKEKAIKWLLHK